MANGHFKYIWRCALCSNHFSNIIKTDGLLQQEKKCSKCKSLNSLTLTNNEIIIRCKIFNININNYTETQEEIYPYPESPI